MSAQDRKPGFTLTGPMVLGIAVGCFAVVFAVNFYMMSQAIGGFPGVVVDHSYRASQSFDARRSAQVALGWTAATRYEDGALIVSMTGRDGAPVEGLAFDAVVGRPSNEAQDRPVALAPFAGGYRAETPLEPGLWRLALKAWNAAGDQYETYAQFIVRPGGETYGAKTEAPGE